MGKPKRAAPVAMVFPRAVCGLFGALAFAVHATSLRVPFLHDDFSTVLENPSMLRPLDLVTILLYTPFRPLLNVSYVLDHAAWGFAPLGFHLTNVVLHSLNTLLVFRLGWHWEQDGAARTPPTGFLAPVAAGVFAVHPLLTEAVSYVSGRSEVLCGFFFLLGLLAARRACFPGQRKWIAISGALLLMGLASKEIAALMPFVALGWAWLRFDSAQVRRRALLSLGPLLGLMILGGVGRAAFYLMRETGAGPQGIWQNFLLQLIIFWRYVGLFVFPVGQSLVHPFSEVTSPFDPGALAAGGALVAAGILLFRARHSMPAAAFGALWFLLLLLPSSSLIPLAEPMSEHRTYVAAVGLCLAAGAAGAWLLVRYGRAGRAVLAVACAGLAGLTVVRNQVWSDPKRLWSEAAQAAPRVWAAQYGLGEALRADGQVEQAASAYERATALIPTEPRAWLNLGICLGRLGRVGPSYQAFARALELTPGNPAIHTNLGTLALLSGNPATARAYFERAAQLDPGNAERRGRVASAGSGPDTKAWPPR